MNAKNLKNESEVSLAPRKPWEKPCVLLERSLEVSAYSGPPGVPGMPNGFIGPLGTSGGSGMCK